MTEELPQFRSCCCCVPLRAGLLFWGYFKMIADILILIPLMYLEFYFIIVNLFLFEVKFYIYSVVTLITIIAIIVNFVATVMFVIGCHQKKVKRIRGFYFYSIWELKLMIALNVAALVIIMTNYKRADATSFYLVIYMFIVCLLTPALHAYIILLLRSEVVKLNGSFEVSVVNNSAEAEHVSCRCTRALIENV